MKTPKPHPDSRLTLRQCFERYYDKSDLARLTKQKYHYDLLRWERRTGDPAIGDIDNDLVAKYRADCLAEGVGAETINTSWNQFRAILRSMAVPALGNPRGRGVLQTVPYMKPCQIIRGKPKRIPLDDLNKAYLACDYALYPRVGIPPADWWRGLLTLAYFTGLRKGDLLNLRHEQFDLQAGTLLFRASKTAKEDLFPLHPVAIQHLRTIWLPQRERFFRGPPTHGSRTYKLWHDLLDKAEVPRFTLHDIRRTAASEIERVRPGMAKVFLQHAARDVTGRNYLNMSEELKETILAMRVPEVFEHGPRIAGEIEARLRAIRQTLAAEHFAPPPRGNVPEDWLFTPWAFAYRGTWFRCTGPKNRALQSLVNSPGPVAYHTLAAVLLGPLADVDDKNAKTRVRGIVYDLRRSLRDAFGLPDHWDSVPCVDRMNLAYTISLPPSAVMGGAA